VENYEWAFLFCPKSVGISKENCDLGIAFLKRCGTIIGAKKNLLLEVPTHGIRYQC
jgi:hypothetical protein